MVGTDGFNKEVKIQQHIFNNTNTHLQPITPLIYYSKVHGNIINPDGNLGGPALEFLQCCLIIVHS